MQGHPAATAAAAVAKRSRRFKRHQPLRGAITVDSLRSNCRPMLKDIMFRNTFPSTCPACGTPHPRVRADTRNRAYLRPDVLGNGSRLSKQKSVSRLS